ncbi:MAG: hypothetical protein ACXVSE_13560 [Solirubrobacteraceae bacterium]
MIPTRIVAPSWRRGAPALAAAAVVTMSIAGCGGSSPPSSTNSGTAQAQGPGATAYKFSACMRSHGVAKFPDPVVHTTGSSVSVAIRVTPALTNSPAFKSAQSACNHILPKGGPTNESPAQQQARTRAIVAFAQCLRTHGFPHFPDPDAQGHLTRQMLSAAGIDLHTPALLNAAKRCTSVTHGQITPAQVVRAINGPH